MSNNNISIILNRLTDPQRIAYDRLLKEKTVRASGRQIRTFRSLFKLGIIKNSPQHDSKNVYVLNCEPIELPPPKIKLPTTKEYLSAIIADKPKEKMKRPPATYSNTSREQHVEKWINTELPAQKQKRIGYNTNKKTA